MLVNERCDRYRERIPQVSQPLSALDLLASQTSNARVTGLRYMLKGGFAKATFMLFLYIYIYIYIYMLSF